MRRERWTLTGPEGLPIHGESDLPDRAAAAALIVHGFTGSKDRNIIPALGRHLAEAGMAAHRFTMTHAGLEKDADQVTRLDEFARDSAAICMQNIRIVFQALRGGHLPGDASVDTVTLIGHSRAGATVLGYAGRAPSAGWPAPDGVVSVAGLSNYWTFTEETATALARDGYVEREFARSPTGAVRLGPSWFEHVTDADHPRALFESDLRAIKCPVLLVHGGADANVPLDHPERVRRLLEDEGIPVDLHVVPDADHNLNALGFGADHDNIRSPQAIDGARAILDFIRQLS